MNYYISDLHLNHKNVTKEGKDFDGRPFNTLQSMHEYIERKWNSKIKNDDTVYILGDMVWILNEETLSMVARLKGHKVLIQGNHDKGALKDHRFKTLFDEVVGYKEIVDNIKGKQYHLVLSHYPIMMWNSQHKKNCVHLYGHVHNSSEWDFYKKYLKELVEDTKNKNDKMDRDEDFNPIAINVGCMLDYMNYEPKSLQELLEIINK